MNVSQQALAPNALGPDALGPDALGPDALVPDAFLSAEAKPNDTLETCQDADDPSEILEAISSLTRVISGLLLYLSLIFLLADPLVSVGIWGSLVVVFYARRHRQGCKASS